MHELSIVRNIINIIADEASGAHVVRVKVEVGELSCVLPDALQFCFSAIRDGTALQSADLEIDQVPGRARCLDCGDTYALPATGARCGCGSMRQEVLAGDELKIVEFELE